MALPKFDIKNVDYRRVAKWIAIFCLFFVVVAFTPLRLLIPGYPNASTKREAIRIAMTVDSLRSVIGRWELYAENLSRVIAGEDPIPMDSIFALTPRSDYSDEQKSLFASSDTVLRSIVAEAQNNETAVAPKSGGHVEGLHFFTPVRGAVAVPFDYVAHPYVDISAPEGSVVSAVLGGTVIAALWSDADGYVVVLQHDSDVVSIYRHTSKLLKKTGDVVESGASLAIVGAENCLSFELWHNGVALNPEQYIKL